MTTDIIKKFNVNVVGSGTETLVLAHGFGSEQGAWRHQIEAFKDHYRIVLFDYLGCGKSDVSDYNPRAYNSFDRYRDDLLAIYRTLDLTDTIYVGHSSSAMIGMLSGFVEPQRFRKLIFIGASPRYLNDETYVGGFERTDLKALYNAMATNYLAWANGFAPIMMGNAEKPELGQEFAHSLSAMRPDIAQSTARVIFESDLRNSLSAIRHPVLVLQSSKDNAVPVAVGNYLADHISGSQMTLLDGEGHLPHLSAPENVIHALRGYFVERPA